MERLTIGRLAKGVQVNPKTIRYYEHVGLMPRPPRDENGYRLYSVREVNRLQLIKRAKSLGLSLKEVKQIVSYAVDGHCVTLERHLVDLLQAKILEIDLRRAELAELQEQLRHLHHGLSGRLRTSCLTHDVGPDSCQCLEAGEGNGHEQVFPG